MSSSPYVIGIDTGGTYTDAVLICPETGRVECAVKVPTAPHDPALSIRQGLAAILARSAGAAEKVQLVSVSTTLATNALVEGTGADVGLFIIGFDKRLNVPAADLRYVPGGHKAAGVEAEPLGMEFLVQGIQEMRAGVDAYAVCSLLAIEDPTHELVAAKAIALMDPKPVFCSHQASSLPGMQERASTAVLNARLLPVMRTFLDSIGKAMGTLGLSCPVRIVRGDCSAMDLEQASRNSSSTVASGPAATALFGSLAAGDATALIVDVGGTTTDITLVRDGAPVIREGGMVIGAWRTHVQAVEMYTVGLGGDSLVRLEHGAVNLGPARVIPLSQAHLHLQGPALERMRDPVWLGEGMAAQCVAHVPDAIGDELLAWLAAHGPATPATLRQALGLAESQLEKSIARLCSRREAVACGFTPTDALHVLGLLDLGETEPARRGATVLAEILGVPPLDLCAQVIKQAETRIATTILAALGTREVGPALAQFVTERRENPLLDISIRLKPEIIGIGAAAPFLLPGAARLLGTTVRFPDHYEVGNAVGAALMDRIITHKERSHAI